MAVIKSQRSPGLSFNLHDQLAFYGSYHSRGWNQAIHFVFVPLIMWSLSVWLAYAPPLPFNLPAHMTFLPPAIARRAKLAAVPNAALVVLALYALYYTALEPFAGLSWGVLLALPMWLSATAFAQRVPYAWALAIGVHVLSWFAQVQVGHIMVERRKPALLDSAFQSFVLAGVFAWIEGLFFLGYRPKLQAELQRSVAANLRALQAEREALLEGDQAAPVK